MARGDFLVFNQFVEDLGLEVHNLDTDDFQIGLVDDTITPAIATADPRWGAAGGTDLSVNEVDTGETAYTGPISLTSSYSETAGVGTLDFAVDPSIAQDAAGPIDIYWGIVFNNTAAGLQAIGFLDLGGPVSLQDGPLVITWNVFGAWRVNRQP